MRILIKNKDKIIDIIDFLPERTPSIGSKIKFSTRKNKVTIFWINKDKKGRILNPQNQPKPITVPRYISIDENLGEALGIYFGDGTKNDYSSIELINSCPEILKLWKNHIVELGICLEELHYNIKLSENVKTKYNISETEIEKYWRESLKISPEKNISINWINTKGRPSSYLEKHGSLTIRYFDVNFSLFYNSLISKIESFLEMSEDFRIGFIRGLIASDGNINFRKNGSLGLVRIAGNKDQRKFVANILKKYFEIETNEDKNNQIYFGSYKKLNKVKKLQLHTLHPRKRRVFEKSFEILLSNLTRSHDENAILKNESAIKILKLLKQKPFKNKEIINQSTISRDRIKQLFNGYKHDGYHYRGLEELGLVFFKRNVDNRCEKIWYITQKGREFLKNLTEK